MKHRKLFIITSLTTFVFSCGMPVIAQIAESTRIENKQFQTNQERQKSGLIGTWKASTISNNVPTEIVCQFRIEGIEDCSYTTSSGTGYGQGTWAYDRGNLYFSYPDSDVHYSVEWISQDEFILRSIKGGITAEQRFYRQSYSSNSLSVPTPEQQRLDDKLREGSGIQHWYGIPEPF